MSRIDNKYFSNNNRQNEFGYTMYNYNQLDSHYSELAKIAICHVYQQLAATLNDFEFDYFNG